MGLLRRLRPSNSIVSTQQLLLRLDIIIRTLRRQQRVWEGWEVLGVLEGWGEWYMEHLRGVIVLGILVHLGRLERPVQAEEVEEVQVAVVADSFMGMRLVLVLVVIIAG